MLGMDWSEVHGEAEKLEHAVSDKVLAAIDAKLGSPTVDPHGDPIPTQKGKVATVTGASLADCELRRRVRVSRVLDQQPAFLQLVDRFGLKPGTTVRVEDRDIVASAVLVAHGNGDIVTLGLAAAEKILVE
jgi:DtxR family Mn-dependent transcriptional regulator